MRQADGPAEEEPVADVKRSAAVVSLDSLRRIGGKAGCAKAVTVGVAEHVKAEDGQARARAHVEVGDQLVLVVHAIRLKLILRSRNSSHNIGKELVHAVRMQV